MRDSEDATVHIDLADLKEELKTLILLKTMPKRYKWEEKF